MKRPSHAPSVRDEAVEATAAAWLAERDAGLSPEDAAAFARWRQADPRHEAAVVRLESAWGVLQQLREFRPEAHAHPDRDLLARRRRPATAPFPAPALTAALAACATLVIAWWWRTPEPHHPEGVSTARYVTTAGGYQRSTLVDGSVVELNASTEVREHFTPTERRVQLVRGEATFIVAKNPARPFVVQAGDVAVRAVGTAFNVRLLSDKVEVLVTQGRVKVNVPTAPDVHDELPELTAGQKVVVPAHTRPAIETVTAAAIRDELVWQGSRLVFVETPLAEVVRQFNQRNQLQLEIADAELQSIPVGGSFRAEHVEAFVRLLEMNPEIVVERPGADRIVFRRADGAK